MKHPYLHLDVFTDRPLAGNQLAVFPDGQALDTETMQRIALEMNFSETVFFEPPESPGALARLRIFTPRAELPLAGHPTIGSTFAFAHLGRLEEAGDSIRLDLGVGPIEVELQRADRELDFVWMNQPIPELGGRVEHRRSLAQALNLEAGDLLDTFDSRVASAGVPLLFVPLSSRRAVDAASLDDRLLREVLAGAGLPEDLAAYLFTTDAPAGTDLYSRMFAPALGIPEDPGTGGAGGPLGAVAYHHGFFGPHKAAHLVNLQGVKMERPCEIHISLEIGGEGEIRRSRVGGRSAIVGEGWIEI